MQCAADQKDYVLKQSQEVLVTSVELHLHRAGKLALPKGYSLPLQTVKLSQFHSCQQAKLANQSNTVKVLEM